jgi:leucyl-tRNA synthetase
LLAPFIPHTCEELWRKLGNKTFISSESWPEFDAAAINTAIEAEEDLIKKIIGDVDQIKRISGIRAPAKVTLVISPPWKYEIYNLVLQGKSLGEIMAINKFRELGEPVVAYVRKLERRKPLDELFLTAGSEFEALSLAREFLQERFNCRVEVLKAEETLRMKMPAPPGIVQKAAAAEPARPGILLV